MGCWSVGSEAATGWLIEDAWFGVGGRIRWFSDAHEEKVVSGGALALGRPEERALKCLSM